MGIMPEQSIARTVDYAIGKGAKRFAALVPNGEYGRRAEIALANRVSASGGVLVATERYDRGNTSIISAAERLKARGGFDTVLIADGARLSALAAGAAQGCRRGPAPPPRHRTVERRDDLTRASALRGAWFSAVSDARYRQFVTSYKARFGEQPYRIATLGYDSVLLTLRIARDWKPGRDFPTAQLLDAAVSSASTGRSGSAATAWPNGRWRSARSATGPSRWSTRRRRASDGVRFGGKPPRRA